MTALAILALVPIAAVYGFLAVVVRNRLRRSPWRTEPAPDIASDTYPAAVLRADGY